MPRQALRDLALLPESLRFKRERDDLIRSTTFDDCAAYHPALIKAILASERQQRASQQPVLGGCGSKIYELNSLDCPEAAFLYQRVCQVVERAIDLPRYIVDLSWASVYRRRDYCMPHAHVRSKVSVVYLLDEGDPIDRKKDPFGGRLCFSDPRLKFCCPHAESVLTQPLFPEMVAGTMVVFPSHLIHWVPPYAGKKPRITLSWDITDQRQAGSALKDF